jgi:hypothetical protein
MSLAAFEPTVPARERPQTHAFDRVVTGTAICICFVSQKKIKLSLHEMKKECNYCTSVPSSYVFMAWEGTTSQFLYLERHLGGVEA